MSHLTSLLNFSGSNYSCKTFGKTEVLLYIIVENTEICRPVTLRWLGLPTSSSNSLRSGIQMPTSLFVKCRFADKHQVQGLICQWTDFAMSVMPTGISDKVRFADGHLWHSKICRRPTGISDKVRFAEGQLWQGYICRRSSLTRLYLPTVIFVKAKYADGHLWHGKISRRVSLTRLDLPTGIAVKMRFADGHLWQGYIC